jgi:cell wall-associated NlpC family hydrolase
MESREAVELAAGVAGRGLILKLAGIAGALFAVFLLLMSIIGMSSGSASASNSCGERGKPGADVDRSGNGAGASDPTGDLHQKQAQNAEIIDGVAKKAGLPGRATLIALMTALQESQLLNINHGDRDSIGIFQQRPSTGWGKKEQIMNVEYASKMFFFGGDSGDPPGLTDIKGWESMPYAKAAQAVQRSEDGSLYAAHEDTARQIAKRAKIDLDRAGTANGNATAQPSGAQSGRPGGRGAACYAEPGTPAKPGQAFHDGAANWPADVKNPRSTADAITWAKHESEAGGKDWYAMCLAFVARAYGWTFSGTQYAIQHYRQMPATLRHDKDRAPPPGALMFWDTGKAAGHVAIYLGNGMIASNDIKRSGYIDVVPATEIETTWRATYEGWAPPYFPNGG